MWRRKNYHKKSTDYLHCHNYYSHRSDPFYVKINRLPAGNRPENTVATLRIKCQTRLVLILSASTPALFGCQFKTGQTGWIITCIVKVAACKVHLKTEHAFNFQNLITEKGTQFLLFAVCPSCLEFEVMPGKIKQQYKSSRTSYLRHHSIVYQPAISTIV